MKYNLILSSKQAYLIHSELYDLCNWFVHEKYTKEKLESMDEYDQFRISIYQKQSKYKKGYYIYTGLTERELKFISGEMSHHVIYGFEVDKYKKMVAKRIVGKVQDIFNIELQRDLKLKELLGC